MSQSGTKLVVALGGLALVLGVISWWYRFEAAHRATQYWGPQAAELIVEPGQVEAIALQPAIKDQPKEDDFLPELNGEYTIASRHDLTDARGTVHLRHALTSDRNYIWDNSALARSPWRWALRFHDGGRQLVVLFTADLATLGHLPPNSETIEAISCVPMSETLQQYFAALGLTN